MFKMTGILPGIFYYLSILMKKIIASILISIFFTPFCSAETKDLSYYLKKYNLPETVNILAVFENDCLNCYYGFSIFLQTHEKELTKENFVILFSDITDSELDNFFQYRFHTVREKYRTVIDSEFYASLNKNSTSSLVVIDGGKVVNKYDHLKIGKFQKAQTSAPTIHKKDTLDLRPYFGTNNLKFCMQDSVHAVILN
jgi:hypothetical protein